MLLRCRCSCALQMLLRCEWHSRLHLPTPPHISPHLPVSGTRGCSARHALYRIPLRGHASAAVRSKPLARGSDYTTAAGHAPSLLLDWSSPRRCTPAPAPRRCLPRRRSGSRRRRSAWSLASSPSRWDMSETCPRRLLPTNSFLPLPPSLPPSRPPSLSPPPPIRALAHPQPLPLAHPQPLPLAHPQPLPLAQPPRAATRVRAVCRSPEPRSAPAMRES